MSTWKRENSFTLLMGMQAVKENNMKISLKSELLYDPIPQLSIYPKGVKLV